MLLSCFALFNGKMFSLFFYELQVQHISTYSFIVEKWKVEITLNVLTTWSEIPITCDIRIFWQKLVNFYVASESFPTWNVNNISVVFSSLFPTINFFDPVVGQIFLEFSLNFRQGLLDLSHMIFHLFLTNLKKYLYKMYVLLSNYVNPFVQDC